MKGWALLLLPLVAGCSVSTLNENEAKPTRNQCSVDAECGSGTCQAPGMCRATVGTFSSVLFEVIPPANVAKVGGVQHLKRIDELSLGGGPLDIALPRLARLDGAITPNWGNRGLCALDTGLAEAILNVVVTPSDQLLGLGAQRYNAEATFKGTSFNFSLNVPAADYDIYVEPKVQSTGCLTPQLYRRNVVLDGNIVVPLNLPAPSSLQLRIAWPVGDPGIEGWRVDMIDPDTRSVLSNEVELTSRAPDADAYNVTLIYSPVIPAASEPGRELVRVRPSDQVAAPTILLQRSGLEVSVPGEAEIDQLLSLPQLVKCEGQVVLKGSPESVRRAIVTVSATELKQAAGVKPGISTEYSQTVNADDKGVFTVQLFPGKYQVVAVPPAGSGYATGIVSWEVGETSIQQGRTVEVTRLVALNGSVFTAGGVPVAGATVSAVASPASLVVDPLVEPVAVVPRAGSVEVDANGAFELGADPGFYDLSVRPAPGTGFAWFVRPNINVEVNGQDPSIDLGPLEMPWPLAYSGAVTSEVEGPIPGALIRAYVYVTDQQMYTVDAVKAASVLQIGETRASDSGRFELYIPAQFDAPATP